MSRNATERSATQDAVIGVMRKFFEEEMLGFLPAKNRKAINTVILRLRSEANIMVEVMEEFKAPGVSSKVMSRDDSVFESLDEKPIFGALRLGRYWPDCNPAKRQIIWQYTQSIFMLGTALTQMSHEQLGKIESFATTCADKMRGLHENGEKPGMSAVQGLLGEEMRELFDGLNVQGDQVGGAQEKFDRDEFVQFMRQNKGMASGVDLDSPEFKTMLDDIERMQVKGTS